MKKRTHFPDEILERIFRTITSNEDRNNISLVNKAWYRVEGIGRRRVFVKNCYAVSPDRMVTRFPNMKSLVLEGKPGIDDDARCIKRGGDWGADVVPWICQCVRSSNPMEEFVLRRMVVTDECLAIMSVSFNVKCLILDACHGFSTSGLATIAAHCRNLEVLDVQTSICYGNNQDWLAYFPRNFHALVCLKFAALKGHVNLDSLQRLIAQCPNLRTLRLNKSVPFTRLCRILQSAPNLVDLGTGTDLWEPNREQFYEFHNAVKNCRSLRSLTGFFQSTSITSMLAFGSVYSKLIELDLSLARQVPASRVTLMVQHCPKLQRLLILDTVGDKSLQSVASFCKDLQDLRVLKSPSRALGQLHVTEEGLFAIARGCPKLYTITYYCYRMTNAALITLAEKCPNLTHFKLRLRCPGDGDATTLDPLDAGFGSIAYSCKGLKTLYLTGLLTDKVFLYIGMNAEQLETFSVQFSGKSDYGVQYILNGCQKLKRMELKDCPVGDALIQENAKRLELLQFLWISNGDISKGSCRVLGEKAPMLNVEIIDEETGTEGEPGDKVKKLYIYRTIAGPRKDAPKYVQLAK